MGLFTAEIILRSKRFDEFPLFQISTDIGYLPAPNQAGEFVGRHRWLINDKGQQNESFVAAVPRSLLLIGDSLTWGGVGGYDHAEKLGPSLQKIWPERRVWSVGAGSWAMLNELAYLKRYPEVAMGVDDIVFICNSADFQTRSRSPGELTHPTKRPFFISVYLARKWISTNWSLFKSKEGATAACEPMLTQKVLQEWNTWAKSFSACGKPRIILLWYPTMAELADSQSVNLLRSSVKQMVEEVGGRFGVIDANVGWDNPAYYKDVIHPTPAGNLQLARSIRISVESLYSK